MSKLFKNILNISIQCNGFYVYRVALIIHRDVTVTERVYNQHIVDQRLYVIVACITLFPTFPESFLEIPVETVALTNNTNGRLAMAS